jgi:alpha-D-ribose 1-methylphosphonate 5-triphosphate synthase subunit PhnH
MFPVILGLCHITVQAQWNMRHHFLPSGIDLVLD